MSNIEELTLKLPVLEAIPDDQVRSPNSMPVETYVHEAEHLQKWCQEDKEALIAKGLTWETVDDMPIRIGALKETETTWFTERFTRQEAAAQWMVESPKAYELRDQLIHDMRFAYRADVKLLKKVSQIADGYGHPDMIQDLNNLSGLGKKHSEPLIAMGFDMTLLDTAAQLSDELGTLYAHASVERAEFSESKKLRDRAYTHLKEAVDEIYAVGQYLFWHDEERKKGYRSGYLRMQSLKYAAKPEPEPGSENPNPETPEPETVTQS
ncbi:MAG: hypothetical protein GY940_13465 [bacterium]|nr:hypothetical protein [bacterium]